MTSLSNYMVLVYIYIYSFCVRCIFAGLILGGERNQMHVYLEPFKRGYNLRNTKNKYL